MSKKLILLFGLVAVFNLFLFHTLGSTAFAIAAVAMLLFVIGIFGVGRQKTLVTAVALFILALDGAIIKSANGAVNFVATVTILASIFWLGYLLSARKNFFDGVGELILSPISAGLSYLEGLVTVFKFRDNRLFPILRGLIIGFPVLLIIVGLLATGDSAYSNFISEIMKNIQRLVTHIYISVLLLGFLLPYTFSKFKALPKKIYSWTLPVATEINVVLGLVGLGLASFLIIQWPYIFANISTSLSQYVRRGFIEFIAVAVIVYLLAWAALWVKQSSRLLVLIIFGEFAVFIISIFRRIALYQQYHGWTLARIYGGFFLFWVSGVMAILMWRHFSPARPGRAKRNLLLAEVIFTAAIIMAFSWFNAEDFLVKAGPPTVNNKIDYSYLAKLSADGYEGWKMVKADSKEQIRDIDYLKRKYSRKDPLDQIFQFNWSEYQTHAKIASW